MITPDEITRLRELFGQESPSREAFEDFYRNSVDSSVDFSQGQPYEEPAWLAWEEQHKRCRALLDEIERLQKAIDEMLSQIWRLNQSRAALTEALQEFAMQHRCGCGHPACNNCERDRMVQKALEAWR